MDRLFENLAQKIEGEIKSYVSKRRLNKMLDEVKTDEVSESTLKEALMFDTSKKTQEEQNVNKILVGLMVDSFINKNGQEAFDSLVEELEEKQKEVDVIKPQVVEVIEPQVVEEDVVPVDEPTERRSIKLTGSTKVAGQAPEPVVEPELTAPTPEPIKPVVVAEPVVEEKSVVEKYTEQQTTEWQPPRQKPQPQMDNPSGFSPKIDDEPATFEENVEEELLDEVETEKKGGVLKYLAVGIPTLILVGGLVFWQLHNQKQVTTRAESQAMEILKTMPKKDKKGDGLSESEYEDNIEALTKGIDTIKQDDNTGLSGYLVHDDNKYIIKKYDKASGSLIVFNEKGKEITFDSAWVEKLIKKAKASKSNTEASEGAEKQEENSNKQQEEKQEGNSGKQQEGGNV